MGIYCADKKINTSNHTQECKKVGYIKSNFSISIKKTPRKIISFSLCDTTTISLNELHTQCWY